MMTVIAPFVLDPTEEEMKKMDSLNIKYIKLDSNNSKDKSLVKMAQENKSKVLAFIIENPNYVYGNAFGFGDSEDDFCGYFPNVDIFIEFWNRINKLGDGSASKEIEEKKE